VILKQSTLGSIFSHNTMSQNANFLSKKLSTKYILEELN